MPDDATPIFQYVSGKVKVDTRIFIVLDYRAPYARPETPSEKVVVWCPDSHCFLRFRKNPVWDVYGEDYGTVEEAEKALAQAPEPRKPFVTFKLDL